MRVRPAPMLTLILLALLVAPSAPAQPPDNHLDVSYAQTYTAQGMSSVAWDTGLTRFHLAARGVLRQPLTGEGIRIGVIDTGVDPNHPDLQGQILAWHDFTTGQSVPYDDDTHGTHVAGILAGRGHLQLSPGHHYFPFGLKGIAPGAQLLVAKAMNAQGHGDPDAVAAAITWLVDPNGDGDPADGAHVINLSIGVETAASPGNSLLFARAEPQLAPVRSAIHHAVDQGVVIVVAAGNHEPGDSERILFPGTIDSVVTVGATDRHGSVAAFSNLGGPDNQKPDVVAPGVILSTFQKAHDVSDGRQDGYLGLGGTSMAAPVVTGVIALAMEARADWREKNRDGGLSHKTAIIRAALINTARDGGTEGWDAAYGHGALDAHAFLVDAGAHRGPLDWTKIALIAVALGAAYALWRWRRHVRLQRRLRIQRAQLRRHAPSHDAPQRLVAPVTQPATPNDASRAAKTTAKKPV